MPSHRNSVSGYAAFSDESRHSDGRFRSIAAVSLPANSVVDLNGRIATLLTAKGIGEFKWQNLTSAKARFAAIELVDLVFNDLLPLGGRVDVLIWDIEDSRHTVPGRDDRRNYERMFFHLHRAAMKRREGGAAWHIRPDERVEIDWDTIRSCLTSVGAWRQHFDHPLLREAFSETFFSVASLREVISSQTPLCQLADFFAGIAPYSRERSELIKRWLSHTSGQGEFYDEAAEPKLSGGDRERLPVLKHLADACKRARLGVSLADSGYLQTKDPSRPMNFWHYKPQHDNDRAPTRNSR